MVVIQNGFDLTQFRPQPDARGAAPTTGLVREVACCDQLGDHEDSDADERRGDAIGGDDGHAARRDDSRRN